MAEYIDREAALSATCQNCSAKEDCLPNERCADYELINSIPAADVAPVVRCKDCKHWSEKTEYDGRYSRCEFIKGALRHRSESCDKFEEKDNG